MALSGEDCEIVNGGDSAISDEAVSQSTDYCSDACREYAAAAQRDEVFAGAALVPCKLGDFPFGDPDICVEAYLASTAHGMSLGPIDQVFDWLVPVRFASTNPTLPAKTIVVQNGIIIEHYYHGKEHGPAHAHVLDGDYKVRIGPMGGPLKGDPPLNRNQQRVVDDNRNVIRHALNRIGRWLQWKDSGDGRK